MENLSDTYYIHRILEGNTSCFACLLDKYSHPLFNLIYRIVGNKEDAEELTEDVFMKAFQQLESFEGRGDFSNWLYKIAYNMSITAVRKKKVELLAIDDFQLTNASSDFWMNRQKTRQSDINNWNGWKKRWAHCPLTSEPWCCFSIKKRKISRK